MSRKMGDCIVEMVVESLNIDENAEYSAKVEQGDMVEIGEKPELVGIMAAIARDPARPPDSRFKPEPVGV